MRLRSLISRAGMSHAIRAFVFAAVLVCLTIGFASALAQDVAPVGITPTEEPPPSFAREPRRRAQVIIEGELVNLELFFIVLNQGRTGVIRVAPQDGSATALAEVRGRFLDRDVTFYPADDGYYALLAASMEQPVARSNPLEVNITTTGDRMETVNANVEIVTGEFIRQQVTLPPASAALIDPALDRSEIARLYSVFDGLITERAWDADGFTVPVGSALTSPFGAFRTFNETFNTRHTGWDFRVGVGAPLMASAAGRVVYAGDLPIRGSHVIVDHGVGVYTGYSHLATRHVTQGQMLARGQVIGTVGTTGRVSGAHFHWEVAVNGAFVDGAYFVTMWMP